MNVEFIVDTGFEGELALPASLVRQLDAVFALEREIILADGTRQRRPYFRIALNWHEESRVTEIAVLGGGNPLLGVELLAENLLQIEMTDGGEVSLDPL